MRSRRSLLTVVMAGLWAASAVPALASDSGTVEAQVTVATPCIIVTPASADFGTLPFSSPISLSQGLQPIQLQNCGTAGEQLYTRGTDASVGPTAIWALVPATCTGTLNQFALKAKDDSNTGPNVDLTTTDQFLETVAGGGNALTNRIDLTMPCAGSDGIGETLTFQAIFTATF